MMRNKEKPKRGRDEKRTFMKTNKNRGNNALLIMLVTSPIWIIPLALLVDYLDEKYSAPKVEKVYNYPRYEYPDDTILAHPERIPKKGESIMPRVNGYDGNNGVVLTLPGGNKINTGLSSEEILEQLDLDYQDVYDYYGGAEELY
jgi:hypothetical protein